MLNLSYVLVAILLFISNSSAAYEDARCKCLCTDQSAIRNNTKPTTKVFVKATSAEKCTCKFMLGPEQALCPYCDCKYQVRNTTTIKVVVFLILVVISGLTLYMVFLLLLEPLLSIRRSSARPVNESMSCTNLPDGLSNRKPAPLHRTGLWRLISPFNGVRKAPASGMEHQQRAGQSRDCSENRQDAGSTSHSDDSAVVWSNRQWSKQQLLPGQAKNVAGEVDNHLYQRFPGPPLTSTIAGDQGDSEVARVWSGIAVPASHVDPSQPPLAATGVSTVVSRVRDQQQRWKGNVEAQRARVFSEHTLLN